jgi:uncharacterized protein
MAGLNLLPFFMIGLLGAVHCVGMCGGIVGALSLANQSRRRFPVAVVVAATVSAPNPALDQALRVIAYNAGRLASYMVAGAIAGAMAGGARALSDVARLQIVGYWLANLMLVALGLYLMGAWSGLARLEQAGSVVWRRVQPLMRPLLPMDTMPKALALGALWGWVPCGMVYSVLLAAMLTGSPWSGAAVMLAFGLGTLPALLAIGMAGARLRSWVKARGVRVTCGLIVLAFGVLGLIRAGDGLARGWLDAFCLTPAAVGHE